MDQIVRKSSQEIEIDHLLEEEFLCDPTFAHRFLAACGQPDLDFRVDSATAEPSLGGVGFGDLLIEGSSHGERVALLIEDKITAGPAIRQSERYSEHAARMREGGWSKVLTILVAPAGYRGERDQFHATISLEMVAELIQSPDSKRLAHRRGIINRAIEKRTSFGVKIPDLRLHELKAQYLDFVATWCAQNSIPLQFPQLRSSYYDGDSWVDPIRHPALPDHLKLRHRWWTSVKDTPGQVDLIAITADEAEVKRFADHRPLGATFSVFSKGKGVQISLNLPQMRQGGAFNPEIAQTACQHMWHLVDWYLRP